MKCNHCGAELLDGAAFCGTCGAAQTAPEAPSVSYEEPAVITPAVAEEPVVVDAPVEEPVVAPAEEPAAAPAEAIEDKPKKAKKPIGLIIAACIAAVLSVVVVLGLCTNWFGFFGPATRIALAAKNTVEKGNFTIVLSTKTKSSILGSDNTIKSKMTIQADMDIENRELTLLCESEQKSGEEPYSIYIGIIDGYAVTGYKSGEWENYSKQDISDQLDAIFDAYEDAKDLDWDEIFELIEDSTNIDLEDLIDIKAFKKCVITYFRKLNNDKWLKENAGYSTTKENGVRYYEFDPNIYKFTKASLEFFKDAFEDKDDYNDTMEGLKSFRKTLNDIDIEIVVGIKSSKLAEVEVKLDTNALSLEYAMEFKDIGKTTIDVDFLEEMLDKAN